MTKWIGLLALIAICLGCATDPCDINGDRDVDDLDFVAFQSAFNSCDGDANFNERADTNGDGCVTQADFSAYIAECGGE